MKEGRKKWIRGIAFPSNCLEHTLGGEGGGGGGGGGQESTNEVYKVKTHVTLKGSTYLRIDIYDILRCVISIIGSILLGRNMQDRSILLAFTATSTFSDTGGSTH